MIEEFDIFDGSVLAPGLAVPGKPAEDAEETLRN